MELFQTGGGYMGDVKDRAGMFLKGGGLVWKDAAEESGMAPQAPASAIPTSRPALVAATMRAFTQAAPSLTTTGAPTPAAPATPSAPTGGGGAGAFRPTAPLTIPKLAEPSALPGAPTAPTTPAGGMGTLQQSLMKRYTKPSQWWTGAPSY